jgi:hypothetical protein
MQLIEQDQFVRVNHSGKSYNAWWWSWELAGRRDQLSDSGYEHLVIE